MNAITRRPYVYDAGALVAAERGDERFAGVHDNSLRQKCRPIVPTPVLTQVWRGGSRQTRLSMVLHGCDVEPTSEEVARSAGVLLGRSGTTDAVDAIVVATAARSHAVVVTSDLDDLRKLAGVAPDPLPIDFVVV